MRKKENKSVIYWPRDFILCIMPFGWVTLRTFRLAHGLVRCKHRRRCSRKRGVDVSFSDITIKIPDRRCDQGCEWRHAPEACAEIWETSVSWVLGPRKTVDLRGSPKPGQWPCDMCRTWFGADRKVSLERWHLSPYVEKPLNSKVIKGFVPELRSRKFFFCFGIPMLTIYE